ncbi:hypothetical protein AS361_14865 [Myroides marinus]|uniref:hypothetical protein n=2 Tax=Myroides marinus TaxID=703342 RepID=UPI000741DAB2|nr:hypothetical protein [Myroides marinus]KUF45107.1 hypothetical protein AS361_14865 [Myroides marinus]
MNRMCNYLKMNKWRISVGIMVMFFLWLTIYCFELDDKFSIALIATTITIYIGLIKQNLDDDKLFQDLFQDFNSRYDDKVNDLFNKLREEVDNENNLGEQDKLLVIDYLNLCSEEYLWYSKGRLLPEVWKAWEQGIIANLKIPKVKELFDKECLNENSRKSYYGFIEYIEKKI